MATPTFDLSSLNALNSGDDSNPLAMAGKIQALQNAAQQNQALKYQNKLTAGKIRYNQILADNTDDDGTTHYLKAESQAAKDPDAATYMAAGKEISSTNLAPQSYLGKDDQGNYQTMQHSLQAHNQMLDATGQPQNAQQPTPTPDQLKQIHDKFDAYRQAGQQLLDKDSPTTSDVIGSAAGLVAGGHVPLSDALNMISSYPTDPNQIKAVTQNHINNINQQQDAVTATHGAPPSAANMKLAGGNNQDARQFSQDDTDYNASNQGGQAQSAAQTPAAPANKNPSIVASAPTGYAEKLKQAQTGVGQIDADAIKARPALSTVKDIINGVQDGVKTGNTTNFWNGIKNTLTSYGLADDSMTNDAAGYQVMQKKMATLLQQLGGTGGTNEQLYAFQNMSPNDKMLPLAILKSAQSIGGQLRAKISMQNALQSDPTLRTNPDKFNDFANQTNNIDTVRASQYEALSPAEKVEYLHEHENDAEDIMDSYRKFKALGGFKKKSNGN